MSGITKVRLYQNALTAPISSLGTSNAIKVVHPIISTLSGTSSVYTLANRKLSVSVIDSPGKRIVGYFEQYPTIQERCRFMIAKLETALKEDGLQKELHEFNSKLDATVMNDPEKHIKNLLAAYARFEFGPASTKWQNYPIQHIESLSGIGHRYSTSAFTEILKYLPPLILDQHGQQPIKFLELGGFSFNDSFLLARDFEKMGLRASGFTGVDIHQQGTIAARVFNKEVVKIKNYQIINEDALKYMGSISQNRNSENCVVAIRFLAVFDPISINLFFTNLGTFLRDKDVFVFNYSIFNDEAKRVGALKKFGYELREKGGMQMLFRNNIHIQTFLTKDQIGDLLQKNNLESMHSQEEQILSFEGNDLVRGQNDRYSRMTEFVIKHSPN